MTNNVHALWLEYFESCRLKIWSGLILADNGDAEARKLKRIEKIVHGLIYPGEGVHFEGDG